MSNPTSMTSGGQGQYSTANPTFRRRVEKLHRLGPRPLGEFLSELIVKLAKENPALKAELDARIDRYSAITPEVLRDLGGDQFPPIPFRKIEGGRQ